MPSRTGGEPSGRAVEADLVLAGRALRGGRIVATEVGISEDGWIVAVGRDLPGRRRRDLGEQLLLPSGVDLHVHLRDPGPEGAAESIAGGTMQAVLGGIATVADMPNNLPAIDSVDRVEGKAARVRGRAQCDVLLYAAARDAAAVPRLGAVAGAFKLYTSPTTGIDRPVPRDAWPELIRALGATGLPWTVHAEAPERFRGADDAADGLAAWDHHRPRIAESAAVSGLLRDGQETRMHFAHVTAAEPLEAIAAAGYSAEVSPHHLLLSTSHRGPAALAKVNPPLRSERVRAELWERFRTGGVVAVASDHAPHPADRKELPFGAAPSGIAGVETMLPLLLACVARSELGLATLLAAGSERPARWLGLPTGRLLPGHRANLYAVDFRRRARLRSRALHGIGADSPFEGREVVFPTEHYVRGERAVDAGEFVGAAHGRVVRPEFARGTLPRP